jgi:ABC-2 type transport system ATP-binding protein
MVPGVLVSIATHEPMELLETMIASSIPYLDIYPFGASLRILIEEDQLTQVASFPYKQITPGLEDVFVHLVKSKRKEMKI